MSDYKCLPVYSSKHCDETNGAGTNYWIPVENNNSDNIRRKNTQQLNNIISLSNTFAVLDNLYESPDKATTNMPKVHKALRARRNRKISHYVYRKMAADTVHATVNSPKNIKSDRVFFVTDCQCCSLMKRDVQTLENEVKSMTEIINILRDELKYNRAYKKDRKSNSTYAEKLKTSSTHCCKYTQLESQLQVALNELSSVKLITNILSEEIKFLKQTSLVDSNADNS